MMSNLGSVTNSDICSLKPGTPPQLISRTYFCVIGRWGYEAPYSSMSPVFPIIQQLFRGLLGNMVLSAVPTSVKGIRMNLSGYFRVAKGGSSHVLSRGHDGMSSRRGSLQPAASHVHQTGKIQTCTSDNNKDCLGFEFEYQDAAGLCLAIMLHGKSANHCRLGLPTLQKRLLHARLCCVPDLHSKPVGCKVHARRQRHWYLIVSSVPRHR
jgi:hypothetical protein